jgi:threonine dehydrogenase-like Zn-dependent dehydrogenase
MRGVLILGDGKVVVESFPDPKPGWGEVVVAMKAAAICGSDLHYYRATAAERGEGARVIPGHEPSGVVVEVGEGVRNVKVGDRVSVYHYRGCGHCPQCVGGNIMWCESRHGYGWHEHGSDADLLLTDERNCLPLPDDMSFATGALFACNTATAWSSLAKLSPNGRSTLVVSGLGPVGLNGVMLASKMGPRIIGIDVSPTRLELAKKLGADEVIDASKEDVVQAVMKLTGGKGADLAFETSGNGKAQAAIPEFLGYYGKAAFVGVGAKQPSIFPASIVGKQLTLMGSFVAPINAYYDMLDFVRKHRIDLDKMVTHRVPLEDAPAAFKMANDAECGKIIFEWT